MRILPRSETSWRNGRDRLSGACQGAGQPRRFDVEESPGSTKRGWRVTPAEGNFRESATESIPPMAGFMPAQARVKGCGKSAPGLRQRGSHGKPHPEQGRIGAARRLVRQGCFAPGSRCDRPGWLLEPRSDPRPRRMAAAADTVRPADTVCGYRTRLTGPLAPYLRVIRRSRRIASRRAPGAHRCSTAAIFRSNTRHRRDGSHCGTATSRPACWVPDRAD